MPDHEPSEGLPHRLMNVRQVAELLGVGEQSIYRWTRSGELPSVRVGRYLRFRPEAIAAWMER